MKKEDFKTFLGVSHGDTIEKVASLFGAPDQVYDNPDNHYVIQYFRFANEDTLSVSFSKLSNKVETVFFGSRRVNLAFEWLESIHVEEPKAMLLDKHIDEIIDILGVPDDEEPDDFFYRTPEMELDFFCPEENDFFCRRIMVTWLY